MAITDIEGSEELRRCFSDILRMRDTLGHEPATLSTLMNVATRYFARSGMIAHHSDLVCGGAAEMTARAAGEAPASVLNMGAFSAMRAPTASPTAPQAQMLVLLHPTGTEPFSQQIAKFLAENRELGLSAIAEVGDEGVLPHLLALHRGFFLDLYPFAEQDPAKDLSTVRTLGQGDLLLRAPQSDLTRLFATGAPVVVCGALTGGCAAQIRRGTDIYLSLSTEIFSALQSIRPLSAHAAKAAEQQIALTVSETGDSLFGGVTARGGCAASLLSLIGEMLRQGADSNRMTLTAVLEMPPLDPCGDMIAAALPMIAELHRIEAELVLPCHAPRIQGFSKANEPTLTVFVCAERTVPPADGQISLWQVAAEQRDYAALRRLLRPTL